LFNLWFVNYRFFGSLHQQLNCSLQIRIVLRNASEKKACRACIYLRYWSKDSSYQAAVTTRPDETTDSPQLILFFVYSKFDDPQVMRSRALLSITTSSESRAARAGYSRGRRGGVSDLHCTHPVVNNRPPRGASRTSKRIILLVLPKRCGISDRFRAVHRVQLPCWLFSLN